MAVGTVSSLTSDNWQTIATVSSTSGTSVSIITGLTGYKKLMLTWSKVTTSAAVSLYVRYNSDSTAGNYVSSAIGIASNGNSDYQGIVINSAVNPTNATGFIIINNVLDAVPKVSNGVSTEGSGSYGAQLDGAWFSTSAITSITAQGGTFTAGTWTLYGIAA